MGEEAVTGAGSHRLHVVSGEEEKMEGVAWTGCFGMWQVFRDVAGVRGCYGCCGMGLMSGDVTVL